MMKQTLAIVLLIVATSSLALGQSKQQATPTDQQTDAQRAAKAELNEAARAYMAGKFAEAQRHSERALELDPKNKPAPSFLARSIHAQYRKGYQVPENIAIAHDAIAAYDKLLLIDPENEEALKSIVELYDAIYEEEPKYSWFEQRALNKSLSAPKRLEAYLTLANKEWNCSYKISEFSGNKQFTRKENGEEVTLYTEPREQSDLDKAQQCSIRGMEMAEAAISLDPENYDALSFKAYLLLEMAKWAKIEANETQANEYSRLADEIHTDMDKLTSKLEVSAKSGPDNPNEVASNNAGISTAGTPKWQLISKPLAPYPAIGKTARAHGVVVVEITVDEEGHVSDAKAVSGHPLLRAAAVKAARNAVFARTIVRGQPVKVAGSLRYYFPYK